MIWPDIVMMLSGIVFIASLVPQIIKNKNQRSVQELSWMMLILYFIGIVLLGFGYYGLKCWGSFTTNAICGIEYIIIMIQKEYYGMDSSKK